MNNSYAKSVLVIICFALALLLFAAPSVIAREEIHKILDNGPDEARKVILVVGEGYARSDEAKYKSDVDRVVLQGFLGHDVFKTNQKAFNIYRADVWSESSGVSQRNGIKKNTAFDLTLSSNDWESSYFGNWVSNKKTTAKIDSVESALPKVDVFLVLVNDQGWGGVTGNNHWIIITVRTDWQTLCHEMGHALGHLYDEYEVLERYNGPPLNSQNATSFPDRVTVPWAAQLLPTTKVPTPDFEKPANGVGVYEGGATFAKGIYRPALNCRMRNDQDEFCPYCKDLITFMLNSNLPSPKPLPGDAYKGKKMPENMINFGLKITKSSLLSDGTGISPFADVSSIGNRSFVAETYDRDGTSSVQLVSDPFEIRSIPRQGDYKEVRKWATEGRLFLNIPYKSKEDAIKHGLGLKIYQLNDSSQHEQLELASLKNPPGESSPAGKPVPGAKPARPVPPTIDLAILKELKTQNRLKLLLDMTPEKLAPTTK